jgi:hypothetical protein
MYRSQSSKLLLYPTFQKIARSFAKYIGATLVSMGSRVMIGLPFSTHKSRKSLARSLISVLHSFGFYSNTNTRAMYTILPVSSISKYYPDVIRIQTCGSSNESNHMRLSKWKPLYIMFISYHFLMIWVQRIRWKQKRICTASQNIFWTIIVIDIPSLNFLIYS